MKLNWNKIRNVVINIITAPLYAVAFLTLGLIALLETLKYGTGTITEIIREYKRNINETK